MKDQIINEIRENISVNKSVIDKCVDSIELAANVMISVIKSGNKILWCGNGGSAALSSHVAVDFTKAVGIRSINSLLVVPGKTVDIRTTNWSFVATAFTSLKTFLTNV